MSQRIDFPKNVKLLIAANSDYFCAKCQSYTRLDMSSVNHFGEAAHIHAAAKGGPRFDGTKSDQYIRSADNGVWLCKNCHRHVDTQPWQYTAEHLHAMKRTAEARVKRRIAGENVDDDDDDDNDNEQAPLEPVRDFETTSDPLLSAAALRDVHQLIARATYTCPQDALWTISSFVAVSSIAVSSERYSVDVHVQLLDALGYVMSRHPERLLMTVDTLRFIRSVVLDNYLDRELFENRNIFRTALSLCVYHDGSNGVMVDSAIALAHLLGRASKDLERGHREFDVAAVMSALQVLDLGPDFEWKFEWKEMTADMLFEAVKTNSVLPFVDMGAPSELPSDSWYIEDDVAGHDGPLSPLCLAARSRATHLLRYIVHSGAAHCFQRVRCACLSRWGRENEYVFRVEIVAERFLRIWREMRQAKDAEVASVDRYMYCLLRLHHPLLHVKLDAEKTIDTMPESFVFGKWRHTLSKE